MTDQSLVVTDATTWLARGRSPAEAEALAKAWRDFPDLAPSAPLADRMARTRARVIAMRPITEAADRRIEQERQACNFAFIETKAAAGRADARDHAILRGRSVHDLDWDRAVRFADGWYAATAGWPYRPPGESRRSREQIERAAYDLGFRHGGGDPADLFDAARRSFAAAEPIVAAAPASARPLPSTWPRPRDDGRPVPWRRRLAIISEHDPALDDGTVGPITRSAQFIDAIRQRSKGGVTLVLVSAEQGFIPCTAATAAPRALTPERADELIADPRQRRRLRELVSGSDYHDLLVAAQGDHLRVIDAFADALPLCRRMERTRNTPLQQRAHIQLWLDRAPLDGGNTGAGHIRWGKLAQGLTGRLGEFVARYAGRGSDRRHRIVIELADRSPAQGYAAADGHLLAPEVRLTNKAHLRSAMAVALRQFGGATRLGAVLPPPAR